MILKKFSEHGKSFYPLGDSQCLGHRRGRRELLETLRYFAKCSVPFFPWSLEKKVGLLAKMGQLLAEAAQLVPAKYTRQENKCERLFLW